MNITKDIIADLLPAYLSNECSNDTKKLVEEFLLANPEFAKEIDSFSKENPANIIPDVIKKSDEIKTFAKTQKLIKRRTYFMAFAIFFTLVPFSFLYTNGTMYWLFKEAPQSALAYECIGITFWIFYFVTKRKLQGL